jgi:16S rRNA (guanine527-N7)-methyltransferase
MPANEQGCAGMIARRAGAAGSLISQLAADRERALKLVFVSHETQRRLDRYVELLLAWQGRVNLVAASTLPHIWTRHIADSVQLLALAPNARHWVDLGSGAGFPGLVIACALAERPETQVALVESNLKKAAFLREAVRVTGAPARVFAQRIEDFLGQSRAPVDVVTARALAPLEKLLSQAYPLVAMGAIALLPKGQDVAVELTRAAKCWTIDYVLVPSITNSTGRIVIIRKLAPISSN